MVKVPRNYHVVKSPGGGDIGWLMVYLCPILLTLCTIVAYADMIIFCRGIIDVHFLPRHKLKFHGCRADGTVETLCNDNIYQAVHIRVSVV